MNKKARYLELDVLRGIAAILVVLFHYSMCLENPTTTALFKWGITGVDLFFIISGFVISLSINQVSNGRKFIINRVSRLYPTYWASVTFTFLIMTIYHIYSGPEVSYLQYLANMTMFQFYLGALDLDGPYWTMIVEMLFYLFILILFKLRILKYILFIGFSICSILLAMFQLMEPSNMEYILYQFPLLQFFPLFFVGIVFYKIINKKNNILVNYLLVAICFALQVMLFHMIGKSRMYINQYQYAVTLSIYFSLFILFINGYLRFIVLRPLVFLGKISYALYLTHYYVSSRHLLPFLVEKMHINNWVISCSISLFICILIATFITYFIEIPCNKKFRRFLSRFNVKKTP